jgi:hypothetical protein
MKFRPKKFKPSSTYNYKTMLLWVTGFALVGVATLILTRAATPGITVTVNNNLPNPTNVSTYADDQTATITWDKPSNADSSGIVGYYVTWGTQSGGIYTNARQTIHQIIQIQPLNNGTPYNVKVQAVHGTVVQVPTPNAWGGGSADEARADGDVSSGVVATVTPSSARVDQLRNQMTGFFDDFKTSAGALDELKWNTATSGCAGYGSTGAFINNQFHAHTQVRTVTEDIRYCDRSENIARARGVFDITGKTEADPGVVVADFDGAISGRDRWYIDLIPLSARTNSAPLDITSHADAFDTEPADPAMIRLLQSGPAIALKYTGNDKLANQLNYLFNICPDFKADLDLQWCSQNTPPNISAFPEPPLIPFHGQFPTANVRYHWRVEVSPTKVKLYLNGVKLLEGAMPADFANIKKYTVQSNLFSYNTGKDQAEKEQTSILHWDNFGFNGPAQSTVTHNYIDGSSTGTQPVIGTGTLLNRVEEDDRTAKINIPDAVGTPKEARLMYTLTELGYQNYVWKPSDTVVVNGTAYPLPDPTTQEQAPHTANPYVDAFHPFAESILLNPSSLKTGINTAAFTIDNSTDVINLHIELEYNKGTEPAYTTPTTIFGASTLLANIQPALLSHDSYIFIEQDMGLPSGVLVSTAPITPPPTNSDTTKPTITLNSPTNNTTVNLGSSFNASAVAADNVGVTKVEFYIGNSLNATAITSPYTKSLSTTGLNPGTYPVYAIAYDAAGNSATSASNNIIIPAASSGKFQTLPVGATLPSDSQCAGLVKPAAETRPTNAPANVYKGITNDSYYPRVDGNYSGTTDEIIQWAACKWGMDEDLLRAQAAVETYWFQSGIGDYTTNPSICAPTYLIGTYPPGYNGDITHSNVCPESIGLLQVRYQYHQSAFDQNKAIYSTAYNIDYYGASWRSCYNGDLTWLNTVDHTGTYAAGDANGCLGVWFSGRWLTDPANQYIAAVQSYLSQRIWETQGFIDAQPVNQLHTPPKTDTTAPIITVTSPAANATLSGTSSPIQVNASDNVAVSKVEFYMDGTLLGTDIAAPYAFALDTTLYLNGTHTLAAKAYDTSNNPSLLTNVTITITNTNTVAPAVIITAPLIGATISGSFNITVTTNNLGVAHVDFSIDGGSVKASVSSSPYSYVLDTTKLTNGSHTITARAYDTAGNNQPAAVTVTVNNTVPPPPTIASDFNGDGHVDLKDLVILLKHYGTNVIPHSNGDSTGDGIVDLKDLINLLRVYGS